MENRCYGAINRGLDTAYLASRQYLLNSPASLLHVSGHLTILRRESDLMGPGRMLDVARTQSKQHHGQQCTPTPTSPGPIVKPCNKKC